MQKIYFLIFLTLSACSSTRVAEPTTESAETSAEQMVLDQAKADADRRQAARDWEAAEKQKIIEAKQKKAEQITKLPPKIVATPTPEPALQSARPDKKNKFRLLLKADAILENFPNSYYVEPAVINSNNQRMIVYFHGADGPTDRALEFAYELATAGFHVLHYCWYHCGVFEIDPFEPLVGINIRTIASNIKFLTAIKRLKFDSYTLIGSGRGAELVGLMLSNQKDLGINIDAGVMISAPAVTLPARGKMKRKELNDLYKNENSYEKFIITGNVWNNDSKDIPTGTPLEINKFKGPVLIMHGSDDKLIPVENARTLKKKYEENGKQAQVQILTDEKSLLSRAAVDLAVNKIIRFLSGD